MTKRFVPVIHGAALDRPDEQDTIDAAERIATSLANLGFDTEVVHVGPGLEALDRLTGRTPFVVFNLVEALDGLARNALDAVQRLEELGLHYTGVRAGAYQAANGKLSTKACFARNGIPSPAHWLTGESVPPDMKVIVKSVDEHGSLGMDAASVVSGSDAGAGKRDKSKP